MVRYFYAWTPLVIVGTVVLLSLPWLGLIALIALLIVSLGVLAALVWAIVFVPYMLGRTISRRWQGGSVPSPRPAAALHFPGHPHAYAARRIDYRTLQLGRSTDSISAGGRDGAPGQPASRKGDVS
jgi:hypothetical protein